MDATEGPSATGPDGSSKNNHNKCRQCGSRLLQAEDHVGGMCVARDGDDRYEWTIAVSSCFCVGCGEVKAYLTDSIS